jgi:hypothetical protein
VKPMGFFLKAGKHAVYSTKKGIKVSKPKKQKKTRKK